MEKLTLFRGLNGDARHDAETIFARMAADLCNLVAKDGA